MGMVWGCFGVGRWCISGGMKISVVVPVYNEEASLAELARRVEAAYAGAEIIFVDDGSTDGTWNVISQLAVENPSRVKGLKHRKNFGKATALTVGFKHASGEIIFTMDGDLQDDPAEIPNFLRKLDEGYDLVSGWKKIRHDPIDKTLPSKFFNWATTALTGVKLHDFNCGFKAYRKDVVTNLPLYGELHRFIPVFAAADGWRVGEMAVQHHARKFGKSKYGWSRGVKGFLDLLSVAAMTKFGRRPGHLFGGLGVICGVVGFLTLLGLFVGQLMGVGIGGRPLFFFGILCMLLSAQMVTTGVLAEIFLRQTGGVVSNAPLAQTVGFDQ